RGRDVGDVGDPELIWDSRCEVAVHEVRYGPGVAITDGRLGVLAPAHPGQAQHPHESRDPLAADVNAEGRQLRMDPALPVRAARPRVDEADLLHECRIGGGPRRRPPPRPPRRPPGGGAPPPAPPGPRRGWPAGP